MKPTSRLLAIQILFYGLIAILFCACASQKAMKTADRNKETIRIWFEEGWNHNRNDELIERCFSPNWSDGNPLRPNQLDGYEGMRQLVKYYRKTFSEAHFKITHLFANEKYVSLRYEVTAIHAAEAFGIPPTGKHFTSTGIVIYEMENARIKSSWQELDLMGILNQLRD